MAAKAWADRRHDIAVSFSVGAFDYKKNAVKWGSLVDHWPGAKDLWENN